MIWWVNMDFQICIYNICLDIRCFFLKNVIFPNKKKSSNYPQPALELQNSTPTLGGKNSTPPELTPTRPRSWVQPAFCGYVKGPRRASNGHNPQKMPWHFWSLQSPGFDKDLGELPWVSTRPECIIWYCIMYAHIHAYMYNIICTLYISFISICSDIFQPAHFPINKNPPRNSVDQETAMSPSSSNKTKAIGQSSEERLVAPKAML